MVFDGVRSTQILLRPLSQLTLEFFYSTSPTIFTETIMPSFHPPPLTPVSPFFPPPAAGKTQLARQPDASYRPICYENGLLTIDIRIGPGRRVLPDLQLLTRQVINDHPKAPIRILLWNWAPESPYADRSMPGGIAQALSDHFRVLYSVLRRWHSVWFDLKLIEAIVTYLTGGDSLQVPHRSEPLILESVRIKRAGDIKDVKLVNAFLREIMCGRMRDLQLGASDSVKPFAIQRFLRNVPYPVLTRLEIDGFSISAHQVHEILISTVNIVECVVSDLSGPHPPPGCCKAAVPNLRLLKLDLDEIDFQDTRNTGAVFRLLETIAAPDLLELSIGYENIWDDYRYSEFCALCRPRIQKLHLRKMNLNERQLFECLNRHPELEELVLDMQSDHWDGEMPPVTFTQRNCRYLSFNSGGRILCPNLESLSVRDNCIEGTGCFSRMVKNRFKNQALSELIIFGDLLCTEDLEALSSLAVRGLRVIVGQE